MSSLFLGVPSAPGQVIGTRVTDTSVLIQWSPPKEPNNLIGYYIDQCVKGTKNWTSANHKPHKSTRYFFFFFLSRQTFTAMLKNVYAFDYLITYVCFSSVSVDLLSVVWPKEKPMCSVCRLSMSWVLVMNLRNLHLSLFWLPSVSFTPLSIQIDDDSVRVMITLMVFGLW